MIDEVQRVPTLLSYIQGIVDKRKKKADFILTGSHQPLLAQSITQSLAGRTGIVRLYPFTQSEIVTTRNSENPFDLCFSGFFLSVPGVYTSYCRKSRSIS
ncbi:MAG: AAA family ATPase [Bacteroidetes bacterium]|nr:AAA family ATPase [Bacteroidota bacterium]